MPIYDFKCQNEECDQQEVHVERLCKVGQIAQCKSCEQDMKKIIVPPDVPKVPHISWSLWQV